ncbi:MAG: hypothetical protein OXH96_10425 [Spirochaetaceae bacterium]|nr:hypothetical protein [Spirochaetaceae bacterium]
MPLFGALGAAAAILAVLVPMIRSQGASVRRELDHLRTDVADVGADVRTLTVRVDGLAERMAHVAAAVQSLDGRAARIETATLAHGERVARIEGALTGPWRPANGSPTARTRRAGVCERGA